MSGRPPTRAQATVQLMRQDPALAAGDLVETKQLRLPDPTDDRFLDGPATRRLAVVDLDPATGLPVAQPVRFVAGRARPVAGTYRVPKGRFDDPAFIAVNAFGTAFKTIQMFEHPGGLGRQVRWAFGREQLLIVPRAGIWANAFYQRATGSLQFFSFPSGTTTVHTALSRDIVAHECGHALLDAVVPSLLDAVTPQSQAIHEAVADLVALLMALDSPGIREQEIAEAGGELRLTRSGALATIGQQFGQARPDSDGSPREALRVLHNDATMDDVAGQPFHVQSTVLSAIFYDTLQAIFEQLTERFVADGSDADAAAGAALGSAFLILRRLLLRGIDYLPPGELTFADLGRATVAADRAGQAHAPVPDPELDAARKAFARRFVARRIVRSARQLETDVPATVGLTPADLPRLRDSDWVAYRFVEQHRAELGIPADVGFTVLPRVDATKQVGVRGDDGRYQLQRELIVKVAWEESEPNRSGVLGARRRLVRTGVTLAIDGTTAQPLALVASDTTRPTMARQRDEVLTRLVDDGLVVARPPGANPPTDRVSLWVEEGSLLRARTGHNLLHLEEGGS